MPKVTQTKCRNRVLCRSFERIPLGEEDWVVHLFAEDTCKTLKAKPSEASN